MDAKTVFNKLIEEITGGNKRQFANIVGRNKQQIYDWSSGKRNPTLDNFIDMLLILREKKYDLDLKTIFEHNNIKMNKGNLRKVEFPKQIKGVIDCGGKGYFHMWIIRDEQPIALIEAEDGTLREIHARSITFVDYFTEWKEKQAKALGVDLEKFNSMYGN